MPISLATSSQDRYSFLSVVGDGDGRFSPSRTFSNFCSLFFGFIVSLRTLVRAEPCCHFVGSKFLTTKLAHLCYFNFAHMRDISVDVYYLCDITGEINSDDILSEITSTCYEIGILV